MSIITLAYPAQAAMAVAQAFSRSAVGLSILGLLITLLMAFRPLVTGFLRATLLAMRPRLSFEQRQLRERIAGAKLLHELAGNVEATQPNLAAEMRYLAARG